MDHSKWQKLITVFSGLQVAPEYKPHPPIFA